ncbi:hypothetical protein STRIP9103_08264 [Streptomyces ipomoeae 91-03]|uniref:Uncharacterized protein n=1 Tax=Streptomyces ipomoeae 91-03 TaxID=698759 RepID=L1L4U9_9ACTN|nr:hypothetical protein STRIP9103_08264 [Streptomyces ipomoeae 91-03]
MLRCARAGHRRRRARKQEEHGKHRNRISADAATWRAADEAEKGD